MCLGPMTEGKTDIMASSVVSGVTWKSRQISGPQFPRWLQDVASRVIFLLEFPSFVEQGEGFRGTVTITTGLRSIYSHTVCLPSSSSCWTNKSTTAMFFPSVHSHDQAGLRCGTAHTRISAHLLAFEDYDKVALIGSAINYDQIPQS